MSAIEKTFQTCLPPDAYLRLAKACESSKGPKFQSSFFPPSKQQQTQKKAKK